MLLTVKGYLERIKKRGIDLILPPKIWQTRVEFFSGEPFIYQSGEELLKLGKREISFNRNALHTIADPFLFVHANRLYLFLEERRYGLPGVIIAYSTSDLIQWEFHGIVLSEEFHLSYPQVFLQDNQIYMLPEAIRSGSTWLYKADEFPSKWRKDICLIDRPLSDPTLLKEGEYYYIFATDLEGMLRLYYAQKLNREFIEHPASPITDNLKFSRCGGSFIRRDGKLYRLAQDGLPWYGRALHVLCVKELTPLKYEEILVHEDFMPRSETWNELGVHHLDVVEFNGRAIRVHDGLGYDLYVNQFGRYWWGFIRKLGLK